jgi:antitoxin ParD1/3/4
MNVLLKPELEQFIDDQVQSGRYDSTADAINAAVARLQVEREIAGLSLDDLRADVDVGLAEADLGEFVEFTARTMQNRPGYKCGDAKRAASPIFPEGVQWALPPQACAVPRPA